ncbi:MAG: histidine--tRNA ligase [Flavobacteriales bacterium]
MSNKASTPKGTRDFSTHEMIKRKFVLSCIETNFKKYGFSPIETPAMENIATLTGKYGDEGDRLIFKVLNSGDFLSKVNMEDELTSKSITPKISEKALRYDLTVPFARYVVQHRNEITFPFKRYQCQPVWRADRPQKGRFREFVQCDADVVGTDSLLCEVELIQLYDAVFSDLGLKDFEIEFNNRKILSGIAEVIGEQDRLIDITVSLDKLDKIGVEKVKLELTAKGISNEAIEKLEPLFLFNGSNEDKINLLNDFLKDSEVGLQGLKEIIFVCDCIKDLGLRTAKLSININLARGLDYYTGAIFEVKTNEIELGSIGGGGRYDNLTGVFGLNDVSGVGISFGFDRICIVLEELELFPENISSSVELMLVNFGENEGLHCLKLLKKLRENAVSAELYPSAAKLKKQLQYADSKNVKYVLMVGEKEIESEIYTLKNMVDGSQKSLTLNELVLIFK